MSRVLDLPSEVLLNITDFVPNAGLDDFLAACKAIRTLADRIRLEHCERKKKYARVTYGDPKARNAGNEPTWIHATLMLRDLLYNDLLFYPKIIHISDHEYENADWLKGGGDNEVNQALESFEEYVRPTVEACPYLYDDTEEDSLRKGILHEGSTGATLGFLLMLLPNLQEFHATKNYGSDSEGIGDLKAIMDNLIHAINNNPAHSSTTPQPLTKLRRMHLTGDHVDPDRDDELSFYSPFFYLPSMRIIRGDTVQTFDDTWNYPGLHSNITQFHFDESAISSRSFTTYLAPTRNLRKLKYHSEDTSGDEFSMRDVVRKLLEVAGHSLTWLDLSGDEIIDSLRDFKVLRTIKLYAPMLFETKDMEYRPCDKGYKIPPARSYRLIDALPASTVDLYLLTGSNQDVPRLFEALPEQKLERLPKLEMVALRGWPHLGQEQRDLETIRERLDRGGLGVDVESGNSDTTFFFREEESGGEEEDDSEGNGVAEEEAGEG